MFQLSFYINLHIRFKRFMVYKVTTKRVILHGRVSQMIVRNYDILIKQTNKYEHTLDITSQQSYSPKELFKSRIFINKFCIGLSQIEIAFYCCKTTYQEAIQAVKLAKDHIYSLNFVFFCTVFFLSTNFSLNVKQQSH